MNEQELQDRKSQICYHSGMCEEDKEKKKKKKDSMSGASDIGMQNSEKKVWPRGKGKDGGKVLL